SFGDLLGRVADDDRGASGRQLGERVDDVEQQGPATDRMQRFRSCRPPPGSLPGREDDYRDGDRSTQQKGLLHALRVEISNPYSLDQNQLSYHLNAPGRVSRLTVACRSRNAAFTL